VSITDINPTPRPTPSAKEPAWKTGAVTSGNTSSGTVNPERYQQTFGGQNSTVTVVNELAVALDQTSEQDRLELAKLLKNAGYRVPLTGKYNKALAEAYSTAFYEAENQGRELGRPITVRDFLNQEIDARKGYESAKGPSTTISERVLTKDQADGLIQDNYEKLLGRKANKKELSAARKELTKALKDNPSRTTYETRNGRTFQRTTPGLSPEDFITDKITGTEEYRRRELTSPDLTRRLDERKEFERSAKGLGAEEAMAARANTAYGRGIEETKARIEEALLESGGVATPEELDAIATQVYDRAIEDKPTLVRKLIRDTIKVESGQRLGGIAGRNLQELKSTAAANGIDLNRVFGSDLQNWLRNINAGEDIETYKQTIRDVAKIGLPEKVQGIIDRGVDLETIYSPYKRTMASVLEINPESITLDDPTLRSAIGPDREMSIYDFQRNLRQDSRWEFTDAARSEVSGLVNRVLKDFGFVG